jgi:hypothetical protein
MDLKFIFDNVILHLLFYLMNVKPFFLSSSSISQDL